MRYDLLLKGGTLVDPACSLHATRDVAFAEGRVIAVGTDLDINAARQVIDATGQIVSPGMIDLHVHVFYGVSHYGVEPDPSCLARGATTVMDAGSAGADNFVGFRKYVIDVSSTRILAQLNISSQGMLTREIGEFEIPAYADVDKACRTIEEHRDLILGVKVRLTRNSIVSKRSGMLPLERARQAADAAGLPIMVHPQDAWCDSLDDILAVMGPGDILTHSFHGARCGILDEGGCIRDSVHEAVARGVILDVGHGSGSFSWNVVEQAMEQEITPKTISSDLHVYNIDGPVYDLAHVVSKFLHLGMDLEDAVSRVTSIPAEIIHMKGQIGTLAPGAVGDAVIFELRQGIFQFEDSEGQMRTADRDLTPVITIKEGRVYHSQAVAEG